MLIQANFTNTVVIHELYPGHPVKKYKFKVA